MRDLLVIAGCVTVALTLAAVTLRRQTPEAGHPTNGQRSTDHRPALASVCTFYGRGTGTRRAALEIFNHEFEALLETPDIGTGSTADRLERLAVLLARQYGRPQYLGALQIVLNLAHNPQTSQETAAALVHFDERLSTKLTDVINAAETSFRELADSRRRTASRPTCTGCRWPLVG